MIHNWETTKHALYSSNKDEDTPHANKAKRMWKCVGETGTGARGLVNERGGKRRPERSRGAMRREPSPWFRRDGWWRYRASAAIVFAAAPGEFGPMV